MPRALLLSSQSDEYQAIYAHLTDLEEKMHPQGTVYELGRFSANGQTLEVVLVQTSAENSDVAMETERAITYWQPTLVLSVGVAIGLKDVTATDVVAAIEVYGYEAGKVTESGFLPRPKIGLASYSLEQRAKAEARREDWLDRIQGEESNWTPQAVVGTIAAEILYTLASSSTASIQHATASVFRWSQNHFQLDSGMLKIIQAVCKNQGVLLEAANDLIKIIEAEELVDHHPEVVVDVCESLIDIGVELTNPARRSALIAESLTTIVIKLHRRRSQPSQPLFRAIGLLMFERLLALNLRETQSALEALDRRPNRQDSFVVSGRRLRGYRIRRKSVS